MDSAIIREWEDKQAHQRSELALANARQPDVKRLSALQRAILKTAYRWRVDDGTDVMISDIKAEVFEWPVRYIVSRQNEETRETEYFDVSYRVQPGTARYTADHNLNPNGFIRHQLFDREEIGLSHYNTTCASISRALRRLVDRDLLYRRGPGWSLTKHGIVTVNRLDRDDLLTVTSKMAQVAQISV